TGLPPASTTCASPARTAQPTPPGPRCTSPPSSGASVSSGKSGPGGPSTARLGCSTPATTMLNGSVVTPGGTAGAAALLVDAGALGAGCATRRGAKSSAPARRPATSRSARSNAWPATLRGGGTSAIRLPSRRGRERLFERRRTGDRIPQRSRAISSPLRAWIEGGADADPPVPRHPQGEELREHLPLLRRGAGAAAAAELGPRGRTRRALPGRLGRRRGARPPARHRRL